MVDMSNNTKISDVLWFQFTSDLRLTLQKSYKNHVKLYHPQCIMANLSIYQPSRAGSKGVSQVTPVSMRKRVGLIN